MLDKPHEKDPLDQFTKQDIAVAVTISSQVNQRRSIVMQTYIGRDEPTREFHSLTDKLSSVIDRQELKFDLGGLRDARLAAQQNMKLAMDQGKAIEAKAVAAWDERKKGPFKLDKREEAQKQQFLTNIEACKAKIVEIDKEIAEAEAKIAKVD